MIRTIAARAVAAAALAGAAFGAHAACEDVRGADGRFAEPARAAAEALASASCGAALDSRIASVRFWRPERGVYMREEVWAFGPAGGRGTCYVDAEANAAGAPDQVVLRCQAVWLCPDGTATMQEPVTCERAAPAVGG